MVPAKNSKAFEELKHENKKLREQVDKHTREVQIEAALERVRSRTMAMHKSDELRETVAMLYEEIKSLGFETPACTIVLYDESNRTVTHWVSGFAKNIYPQSYSHPYFDHPYFHDQLDAWKSGVSNKVFVFEGRLKKSYDKQIFSLGDMKHFPEDARREVSKMEKLLLSDAFMKYGMLEVFSDHALDEENVRNLQRFAKVFEQTYTRFLDLQKAEEQARLAEIEASLERVRGKTMAMHSSDEFREVVGEVFKELNLSMDSEICILLIFNDERTEMDWWSTGMSTETSSERYKTLPESYNIPLADEILNNALVKRYKKILNGDTPYDVFELSYETKRVWDDYLFEKTDLKRMPLETQKAMRSFEKVFLCDALFDNGTLEVASPTPLSEQKAAVLQRFAKVINQTYTRFLDLQKAEEQTREAEIETALERIRARALAMHHSEEFTDVAQVLREQMRWLDQPELDGCVIHLYDVDPDQFESWYAFPQSDSGKKELTTGKVLFEKDACTVTKKLITGYKSPEKNYTIKVSGKELKEWNELVLRTVERPFGSSENITKNEISTMFYHCSDFSGGTLLTALSQDPIEKVKKLQERAAAVFDLAYKRFLDLQKAEEQAREAQIEAALERVRSRTMAMQSSDELLTTSSFMLKELRELGQDDLNGLFGVGLIDTEKKQFISFISDSGGPLMTDQMILPTDDHKLIRDLYDSWKKARNNKNIPQFLSRTLSNKQMQDWVNQLEKYNQGSHPNALVDETTIEQANRLLEFPKWSFDDVFFKQGLLFYQNVEPLSEKYRDILIRFAKVFEQTYTRFLDLKKAEEQAREAQIEAALERVRSRSMAMHKTDELEDVSIVLYEELRKLGFQFVSCGFTIVMEEEALHSVWNHDFNKGQLTHFQMSLKDDKVLSERHKVWKEGAPLFQQEIHGKILNTHLANGIPEEFKKEKNLASKFNIPDPCYFCLANFSKGYLHVIGRSHLSEEHQNILARFSRVFEQSYIRYLDLQKAEEQAREAQIEAALERVRASALAMHNSEDLVKVAGVLREQMSLLGQPQLESAVIELYDLHKDYIESWHTFVPAAKKDGTKLSGKELFRKDACAFLEELVRMYKSSQKEYTVVSKGRKQKDFVKILSQQIPEVAKVNMPDLMYYTCSDFTGGTLLIGTLEEPSKESKELLSRASKVFDLAYRRFLDLKQAEEQAREAQIEAALERVRSRSMGIQKSDELGDVASMLYEGMKKLGISDFINCGYIEVDEENEIQHCWFTRLDGSPIEKFYIPLDGDPVLDIRLKKWKDQVDLFCQEVADKELANHIAHVTPAMGVEEAVEITKNEFPNPTYFYCGNFQYGYLCHITGTKFTEEQEDLFVRFTRVFKQAYIRFKDLQKAEKLSVETARQSSLDRIRAEIASMRSAEDLNQITPIIWDELKTLEIPFIRCGVFIIDEENGISHTYLSTSQGDPIAALHLPIEGISLIENAVASWKKKKIYTEHWDKQDFRDWTQKLIDRGFIQSKKKYEAGSAPETLDLHFLPFKHGMLYIGNTESLSQEKLDLGQSMADAFSVAYDRYEDFNKLEQAKQKIEEAFRELEAAKDQLVQQEKLASLGQLTAGIAHEIKNPLNFVNNFSDLSAELIQEARDEIESVRAYRDTPLPDDALDEMSAILDDIEANLKTIHKHGTRADGIVKSMLQHSRGGSGKMEATGVNSVVKEFTNLAYHGMRAGKEPIDVEIKLDLQKDVGEIELITEDFSRVILNLCNNAFDAMREKLSENAKGKSEKSPFEGGSGDGLSDEYQPKLTVRTFRKDETVTIEIQDNGSGIPDDIKDKILQPFFTTKKGTAGTGLGLSITHDIVKAHGGSLAVETDASGTTFSITLNS